MSSSKERIEINETKQANNIKQKQTKEMSTPPGVQVELSTLCFPCLSLSVCCMSLNMCLPKGCCMNLLVSVSVSVPVGDCVGHISVSSCCMGCMWLSLTKGFSLYLLDGIDSITGWCGEEWDNLQKSIMEIYKGLSHWLQLISIDPDNKHHCLSTSIYASTFMVDLWLA